MPSCRGRGLCAVKKVGNALFEKYLLYTNLGLSIILTAGGDIIEQKIVNQIRKTSTPWDKPRTARLVVVSGVVGGLASHYWFQYLERKVPGHTFKSVMKKVWLDQLLFSPIYTVFLFVSLEIMESYPRLNLTFELFEKGTILVVSEVLAMPPLQAANFYFVKPKFRVLFDYVLSVFLSAYTSFVKYDLQGLPKN